MTKRISFVVKDNATCGDVSKSIIKMLENNFTNGNLSNIVFFVEQHFKQKEDETQDN